MFLFPIDFGELTNDSLNDRGAVTSAVPKTHAKKVILSAPQSILNERSPPEFRTKVANGHLETPFLIGHLETTFRVQQLNNNSKSGIYLSKKFRSCDHLGKSINWIAFLTKKLYHFRHATCETYFPFHLHATQACRRHVFQHQRTLSKPNRCSQKTRKTNRNLHKIACLQRFWDNGHNPILPPFRRPWWSHHLSSLTNYPKKQWKELIIKMLKHPYTHEKVLYLATFSIWTPEQAKYIIPVNPAPLRPLREKKHNDSFNM